MGDQIEIDDSLYSRQRYMLGDGAMLKIAHSNVFLSGLGGLGVEIAKNVILTGVKSITLHDTKVASLHDLGSQFFLREEDVINKKNRAEASAGRLVELNPYVTVQTSTREIDGQNLGFLKDYQCVVLTDSSLQFQCQVDAFCRAQMPPIKFISAGVRGVFSWVFCDFGDEFEVLDATGEEPKECFVGSITKDNPAVVTTLDNRMHGLQTGDCVSFKEVVGMEALNGSVQTIKVLSPYAFSICDTTGSTFQPYQHGGIAKQSKPSSIIIAFESLEAQLGKPDVLMSDLCKMEVPLQIHFGFHALHLFIEQQGRLPGAGSEEDAERLQELAVSLNNKAQTKVESLDRTMLSYLAQTCRGCFAPLVATLGGVVGQEVLKAITSKYTPIKQWLYLDALEILKGQKSLDIRSLLPRQDRYDALRMCIGDELCRKLANLKLFMVGCGAIGCELLKNFALLGIGTTTQGLMTVTDNDLIEKSNLNRQFLFRSRHIQKPKSVTAASSVLEINPDVRVDPHQNKVCPDTEETLYNDSFFEAQDVIVNALDNVEARRYVDSRCVSNQRALLESGTMGPKGHVQVIVPHLTESYTSQRDPPEEEVPHCTLKSFPAVIEHTIQWARDKFESSFAQKPGLYQNFWTSYGSPKQLLQLLESGTEPEGVLRIIKMLLKRPHSWKDCVSLARVEFEKFFNHKAKQLLHAFPLDTKMKDGSLFWQSPKRPPVPQEFQVTQKMHMMFLRSASKLYADIYGVPYAPEDLEDTSLVGIVGTVVVPEFRPSSKQIETDEAAQAQKPAEKPVSGDELQFCRNKLKELVAEFPEAAPPMHALEFEKDDDSNGHIDFITAVSNLRATMYSIEPVDRLRIKKIAGKIVPAISTTTAAVAGLSTIELIKVIMKSPLEDYRNCFMNLALPVLILSEPGPAEQTVIREGLSFTNWDRWTVHGNKDFKLKDLLQHFETKYGFRVSMVVQGVKMIYVPIMPGHVKRLEHKMTKLLKATSNTQYVDLTLSLESDGGEDVPAPPVRYYLGA